jgi:RNA polymerase sigma-70 factor, ECF subfamily
MMLQPDAETHLIERLKRRESQAMVSLYDRFKRLVYSIAFQCVRDQAVAEDLTQETFWRVWNRIQSFDASRGNLEPWIATIARNRAVDYLRSSRNAPRYSLDSVEAESEILFDQRYSG